MAQESVLLVYPDYVDGSYLEDGAMPYARWTHTYVRGQIEPTLRLALRAGKHGAGHTLGAVHCWPHSAKSLEAADRICARMEADARAAGYTILPDADTEAGSAYDPLLVGEGPRDHRGGLSDGRTLSDNPCRP